MIFKLLKSSLLTLFLFTLACNAQQSAKLDAKKFKEQLEASTNAVILDVRTPGEFSKGLIAKAINVNYQDPSFEKEIAKMDKSKTYFVYCLSGGRSSGAAQYMRRSGFSNVYELTGGILAWQSAGFKLTEPTKAAPNEQYSMADYKKMTNDVPLVIIDFYAPWCGPCKKIAPMLDELAATYGDKIKVIRLDIDASPELAKKLGINAIPVLKFYRNGVQVFEQNGLPEKEALEKEVKTRI